MQKNMDKYEIYKSMYENLAKAMRAGYYYQAIFIEYAILEDRLRAILRYAGVPYINKNGHEDKISRKLDKLRDNPEFANKFVRDRIPAKMVDDIKEWTEARNDLIHNLANIPYNDESVKAVAEKGKQILDVFKNKSASVINHFNRLSGK